MKKTICVVFGGVSNEHEISKKSAYTVASNIDTDIYDICLVGIDKDGKWYLCSMDDADSERKSLVIKRDILVSIVPGTGELVCSNKKIINVDMFFPVLHGKNGEDGTIQGLFEIIGIPYAGCGVLASSASMDKAITKLFADSINVRQAKYILVKKGDDLAALSDRIKTLPLPVFVKASRSGSSNGVYRAESYEEVEKYINLAFEYDNKVLVEEGITGREIECAVLKCGEKYIVSCPGEILSAEEFYTFDSKYNNAESKTVVNPDLPDGAAEKIRDTARRIFDVLDCKDLARVDFFLEDKTNDIVFNEINTMPGFTSISMYPMLIAESGMDTKTLVNTFIEGNLK